MLIFVQGGIVWCELCWPLEQPWQGLCGGNSWVLILDLGWQGRVESTLEPDIKLT